MKLYLHFKSFTSVLLIAILSTLQASAVNDTIIKSGANWKYLDNGTDQGTAWVANGFNDASWANGNAQLGFGDGDESTVVSYGPSATNKYITTYFRKTFTIADPNNYSGITLKLLRDDGAAVYINGVEVVRSKLPAGTILFNTLAISATNGTGENQFFSFTLPSSVLVTGTNVISVEVHQNIKSSNDLSFDLMLIGNQTCGKVTNLNTTNITTSSATLNWNAVPAFVTYTLQYRVAGTSTWTTTSNIATNTKNLLSLVAATNYEWRVKTLCSFGVSSYTSISNFTTAALTPCGIPDNISVSGVTKNSATVSWNIVLGAIDYTIGYKKADDVNWTLINTASLSTNLTNLTNSTTWLVRVAANCPLSSSTFSEIISFTTLVQVNTDSLITSYSNWKYFDQVTSQDNTWKDSNYNDAGWTTGNAELGYGDGDESTVLGYGPDANNKYTTTYFRKSFNVVNPSAYTNVVLSLVRDDGAVVYINGIEVYRNNMPAGTISYTTFSSTNLTLADEYNWQTTTLANSVLVAGNNVIAVEIHQSNLTSADISFNLKLAGNNNPLANLSRQPYLQMVTPTSFKVRWRTDVATNSKVRFGTSMNYGSVVTDNASVTEHEVLISGLTANTKYYYTVGSSVQDFQGSASYFCYTSLTTGSVAPFRVWATGDFGNNSAGQTTTRDAMNTYCANNLPKLWIWMGDNAYASGTDAEFQSNVFAIYPNQMKNIPIYPCLGNHDYANVGYKSASALGTNFPYFNMFTCPINAEGGGVASTTEKYYSYNYGNVHFIVLDSYGALNNVGSPQYNWLQNDLAANTQRFTIAMWHHCPYTMGTHNSDTEVEMVDMRQNIVPLLEQYKVDLVLNGHSHVYERTWMIKGHFGLENTFTNAMKVDTTNGLSPFYLKSSVNNFNGTVYCVCGVSGQGGSITSQGSWPHAAMRQYSKSLFGSMIIDFNGDTLDAKFLTSTGTIYDQFKIVKSGPARYLITENSKNEMDVFPNPFSNQLTIKFNADNASEALIELYNAAGEKIYSTTNIVVEGANQLQLKPEVSTLTSGAYLLRVIIDGNEMSKLVSFEK